MPGLRIRVNWVKLLLGLIIAVLAWTVVETAYVLSSTGISDVRILDLDETNSAPCINRMSSQERLPKLRRGLRRLCEGSPATGSSSPRM